MYFSRGIFPGGGRILRFGLVGDVPLAARDPYQCSGVIFPKKKVSSGSGSLIGNSTEYHANGGSGCCLNKCSFSRFLKVGVGLVGASMTVGTYF